MNIIKKLSIPLLSTWKGYIILLVLCMMSWVVLLSCDLLFTGNITNNNGGGNNGGGNGNTQNILAPSTVKTTVAGDAISISWTSSEGATTYNIYWSKTKGTGKSGIKIEEVESPYQHTGLEGNTTYYYVVTAVDKNGKESGASTEAEAKTEVVPPGNVQARVKGKDISISWDSGTGATSYNIYWSTTKGTGKSGTKIEKVTPPYTHTGLEKNTTYYYVITAVYENGKESGASTEVEKNSPTFSGARNAEEDFAATMFADGKENGSPQGIWSDGTTMWVSDYTDGKLYAYDMATKKRDETKDVNTLKEAENEHPTGIWSDKTTMWVVDSTDKKLYAYNMETKKRDSDNDFTTLAAEGNTLPIGIWSDGTTMWVSDHTNDTNGKLFAYDMKTKKRDETKEFTTLAAEGNNLPQGIWSDGETMWVTDYVTDKIYAYDMTSKKRDTTKELDTLKNAGNNSPIGIWSDGTTMWVSDDGIDKQIYAYELYK